MKIIDLKIENYGNQVYKTCSMEFPGLYGYMRFIYRNPEDLLQQIKRQGFTSYIMLQV